MTPVNLPLSEDQTPDPSLAPARVDMNDRRTCYTPRGTYPYGGPILFVTEPMLIGDTQWRLVVYKCPYHGNVVTSEWCYTPNFGWSGARNWPRFDINDPWLGLPKTLNKLFAREVANLAPYLEEAAKIHEKAQAEAARQPSLF